MQYCYRYWAWTADIRANEVEFLKDLRLWNCQVEQSSDCITIWVPERSDVLFKVKYPNVRRHPVFDRY